MKKLTAVLLVLVMALSACLVMADETAKTGIAYDENLVISTIYPEGYAVESDNTYGVLIILATTENADKPDYIIMIAPDEEYPELERFNDLSEEELAVYAATLIEDENAATVEIAETGMGTKLIVLNENGIEQDYAEVLTIYKGYNLQIILGYDDGRAVAEEDIAEAIRILTDMDFVFIA